MTIDKNSLVALILQRIRAERDNLAASWGAPEGTSTRHLIIDNLLPADVAAAVHAGFPRNADGFFERNDFRERKKTLTDLSSCSPIISAITYALQDQRVIDEISEIICTDKLLPDPTLYAAGLSMMFKDDFLNPHIDNSHDRERKLYRRLNLLYYVTPGWQLANGGNFELWDGAVKTRKTVVAEYNRLLVMETTKTSWHSVSQVVVDQPRCCVSTYVFSPVSSDTTTYHNVTSFIGRPEEPLRRFLGRIDNRLRQTASTLLRTGRGVDRVNIRKD